MPTSNYPIMSPIVPLTPAELDRIAETVIRITKLDISKKITPRREALYNKVVEFGLKEIKTKIIHLATSTDIEQGTSSSGPLDGKHGTFHLDILNGGPIVLTLFQDGDKEFKNQEEYTDLKEQLKKLDKEETELRWVTDSQGRSVDLMGNKATLIGYLREKDNARIEKLQLAAQNPTDEERAEIERKAKELLNS
jgi:hypothetical protein